MAEEETEKQAEEVASVLVCLSKYRRSQAATYQQGWGATRRQGHTGFGLQDRGWGGKGADDCRGKTGGDKQPCGGGEASGIMWSPAPAKQRKKNKPAMPRAPSPSFRSTIVSGCERVATGAPDDPVQEIRIWEGQYPESERPSLTVIGRAHLTIFPDTGLQAAL